MDTSGSRTVEDLDADEMLAHHRRLWRVQRVGWTAMALLLGAAAAGLLGPGPLSRAEAGSPDGKLKLRYERYVRAESQVRLEVEASGGVVPGRELALRLPTSYLRWFKVTRIEPEPESAEASSESVTYKFALSDPAGPANITFFLEPHRRANARGSLEVPDGPGLEFRQTIFP